MGRGKVGDVTIVEVLDFLKARLDDDEAVARADSPHDDTDADRDAPDYHDRYFARVDLHKRQPHGLECAWRVGEGLEKSCFCDYPARVLREVEAKRRIVEDLEEYTADYRAAPSDFAAGRRHAALLAATRVATIYSDHQDFQEEWRP